MRTTALFKHAIPAILLLGGLISTSVFAFDQAQIYTLKPNDQVVILGDSTTADGVDVAGYVRLVDQAINEQIPGKNVAIRAAAAYGATLPSFPPGFGDFIKKATPTNPPTVAIINLGINDSGAGEKGLPLYSDKMRAAVKQLREAKMTVILCTPTRWHADSTKIYAEAVRLVASEVKCPLIDLYAAHTDHIAKNAPNKGKPWELVPGTAPYRDVGHFTIVGEVLQARTILQAFGLKPDWLKFQIRVGTTRQGCAMRVGADNSAYGGGKIKLEPELPTKAPSVTNAGWSGNWPTEQAAYAPGTKVTLTLIPDAGLTIHRWFAFEGPEIKETSDKLTITMDRHMWICAEVKPIEAKKP